MPPALIHFQHVRNDIPSGGEHAQWLSSLSPEDMRQHFAHAERLRAVLSERIDAYAAQHPEAISISILLTVLDDLQIAIRQSYDIGA